MFVRAIVASCCFLAVRRDWGMHSVPILAATAPHVEAAGPHISCAVAPVAAEAAAPVAAAPVPAAFAVPHHREIQLAQRYDGQASVLRAV